LAPAGRLDLDSTGLLVFTHDGRVAKRLIGADSCVEKEYQVWVEGALDDGKIALLRHGLYLDDRPLRPARVERIAGRANTDRKRTQLRFILTEGRKRQIRRMCEQLELRVSRLIRVRIGAITLDGIERGRWRLLRADEDF
ncbi:MAG: pseudouridine synthase, partial [bacterium]